MPVHMRDGKQGIKKEQCLSNGSSPKRERLISSFLHSGESLFRAARVSRCSQGLKVLSVGMLQLFLLRSQFVCEEALKDAVLQGYTHLVLQLLFPSWHPCGLVDLHLYNRHLGRTKKLAQASSPLTVQPVPLPPSHTTSPADKAAAQGASEVS